MESMPTRPDPDDARSALAAADQVRAHLSGRLRLPAGLYPAIAAAVAVQLGTAAVGIAAQSAAGLVLLLAGSGVLLLVAGFGLHRFRRLNGVRVDGLASRLLLGNGTTSSFVYLGALAAATWAAFESQWWAVAIAALCGGTGYALGVRQWWRAYQRDPAGHVQGASPRSLAVFAVLACLGLAALVVAG